jgi:hypothetical protein
MTVFQPQLEAVVKQGERVTHRLWIPLDIISAASANAIDRYGAPDVVSKASAQNQAGNVDWTTTYKADRATELFVREGFHLEEPYRSWSTGLGVARSMADDNATVTASVNASFDWFDRFDITGRRHGRTARSTTNANVGLTQLLSPTTAAHVDYGVTLQTGELGNTWNSVPLVSGGRGAEQLPDSRLRHAFAARVVQGLPWKGSVRASYRLYEDTWGVWAHTLEGQVAQRLTSWAYVRGVYRVHSQTPVAFFTTFGELGQNLRTADSDLARFVAQTWGAHAAVDLPQPIADGPHVLHLDFGYERYFRSNDLAVNMFTWSTGFRF